MLTLALSFFFEMGFGVGAACVSKKLRRKGHVCDVDQEIIAVLDRKIRDSVTE